jgi:hypothetical protein
MASTIGWILWTVVALNALFFLVTSLTAGDPGGRWLFRLQALLWLVGLAVTAILPVSKLHLLWIYPLGAVAPFAIIQRRMDKGMAEMVKRHLEEESGDEVWTGSEMRRLFKPYDVLRPRQFAKDIDSPEFSGWWVASETGVGKLSVTRRADNVKGTLLYKDRPRFYFSWSPDEYAADEEASPP